MDRRKFLRSTAGGFGAAGAASLVVEDGRAQAPVDRVKRLPREVWVASLSLGGLEAESYQEMIERVLRRMEEVEPLQPDVVCLPEVFPFLKISRRPPLSEVAEAPLGPISTRVAEYAKKNACYVVCPLYTREDDRFYNAAVIIDRNGRPVGEYRKTHPTDGEIEGGITPGPLDPPVFKTDFGVIGVQICFDINWHEGWRRLRRSGAEIVFWPSAFCGGAMVNALAWMNKFHVVSSTRFDPTKICDITGEELMHSSRARHWVCAPLNLEKVFLHGWPYWQKYGAIQKRYGRRVLIRQFEEEEWGIIESRCPDLKVADILAEFDIKTHEQHIVSAEAVQDKHRP